MKFARSGVSSLLLSSLLCFIACPHAVAGWTALGPSPITTSPISNETNVEGMTAYGNPAVGAMNIVLEAPGSPGTMYVGTANGGVWKSANAGTSWVPLTDSLSSLSIGDMTFDRSDASKLYIGFGKQSNYSTNGGPLNSIKLSIDGGNTWSSPDTGNVLLGKDIVKMFVDTNLMLVGIKNPGTGETGLYRSATGGGGLALIGTGTGLAAGVISDLKADPNSAATFYASVVNGAATTGVYKSINSGASWLKIDASKLPLAGADTKRILLATSGNTLVAGVVNGIEYNKTVFYRSTDGGNNWSSMAQPYSIDRDKDNGLPKQGLFPSAQFNNASLAIDPSNRNIIYVAGVRQPDNGTDTQFPNSIGAMQYSGRVYRGVYDQATGETVWEPLTHIGTTTNSAPHADSRSIFIDSSGRLIQTDDGGIYALSNPQGQGQWSPLHGNIQVSEVDSSSWNPLANIAIAGMQDNGSAYQIKGTTQWGAISGGDGGANAVNWQTFASEGVAVIYGSDQNMETLLRFRMNRDGIVDPATITPINLYRVVNGVEEKVNVKAFMPFYPALVLNKHDQTLFAVGGKSLYVGQDDVTVINNSGVKRFVQDIVQSSQITDVTNDGFGSVAYGAKDRHYAILGGIGDQTIGAYTDAQIAADDRYGQLWYSDNALTTAPVRLTNFDTISSFGGMPKPGRSVQGLVFDARTGSSNFYVIDGATIWRGTRNSDPVTLYDFSSINGNLPATFIDRRAIEYVSNNGVKALLAGGLHSSTTDTYVNPIYYTIDPATKNGANWSPLGKLLPNAPIFALHYSDTDDVLLASTLGRGLFAMFDFTSYFREATTLTFGSADNDSRPEIEQLIDGLSDGVAFSRPLVKVGTGTLDMRGLAGFYTGGTQFKGGTTIAETENNFGSGGFLFDGGSLRLTSGSSISRNLSVLGNGGMVFTDSSNILTLLGTVSGYGTLSYGGIIDISGVPHFSPTPVTTPVLGSAITLLQADWGFIGTVKTLQQPTNLLPGTRYDVVYNTTSLSFFVTPVNFTDLRSSGMLLSRSQTSVAAVLQNLRPTHLSLPSGENKALFDALYGQNSIGLANAFDQLGASSYATSVNASLAGSRLAMSGLRLRMDQLAAGSDAGLARFAYNSIRAPDHNTEIVMNDASPILIPSSKRENMVWGYGFGRFEQGDDGSAAPGYSMITASGMSGFDHNFTTGWIGGVALGYARIFLDGNNNSGSSDVNSWQMMLYGGYGKETGPTLQLSAGGSFDAYSNKRSIQIGTYRNAVASKADGNSVFSSTSAGWRFGLEEFTVEPSVSIEYARVYRGSAAESGSIIALAVSSARFDALRLSEGLKASVKFDGLYNLKFTPEIRAAIAHDLLDRNVTVQALLAGQPITSESPIQGREIFTGGFGFTVASSDTLAFHIDYGAELRDGSSAHSISGGFKFSW